MRIRPNIIRHAWFWGAVLFSPGLAALEGLTALSSGTNVYDQFENILPTRAPVISSCYRFCRGEPFQLYLAVSNPALKEGRAEVVADFRLRLPDGSERDIGSKIEIFSGKFPGGQVLSPVSLRTRMEADDPIGDYLVLITFTDRNDGSKVEKELKFRLTGDFQDDGTTMSITDLENFLENYYQHPDPASILPAFRGFISGESALRRRGGRDFTPYSYLVAFARLLELNPQLSDAFIRTVAKLPPGGCSHAAMVIAGSGEENIRKMTPLLDSRTAHLLDSFGGKNPLEIATVSEAARIDALWREFTVTGRVEPVRKLVEELQDRQMLDVEEVRSRGGRLTPEERKMFSNYLLRALAFRTLSRNAPKHRLLYFYLEAMLARGEIPAGDARKMIEKIVVDSAGDYSAGGK